MRPIDMAAPSPAPRAGFAKADQNAPAGGFDDLLQARVPPRKDDDTITTADEKRPAAPDAKTDRALDLLSLTIDHDVTPAAEPAPDAAGVKADPDAPREAKIVEPTARLKIDWLSLRMPTELKPATEAAPVMDDEPLMVDDMPDIALTQELPVAVARDALVENAGRNGDAQIAAVQAKRADPLDRTDDNRPILVPRDKATPQNDRIQATIADMPEPTTLAAIRAEERNATPAMSGPGQQDAAAPSLAAALSSATIQSVPAPAMGAQGPAQTVLAALSEEAPDVARAAAVLNGQPQTNEPMRILRIQLHPLELGVVTAKLSMQGGEMSVELQTETREAANKLSVDSAEIAQALRGLGIDIDRVTVTQASSNQTQTQDQSASPNRGDRFASDGASGDGARQQGQRGPATGTGGMEGERNAGDSQTARGVFI